MLAAQKGQRIESNHGPFDVRSRVQHCSNRKISSAKGEWIRGRCTDTEIQIL